MLRVKRLNGASSSSSSSNDTSSDTALMSNMMPFYASSNNGHSFGARGFHASSSGNGQNGGFVQRYGDGRPGQTNGRPPVYCDFCHIRGGHTREACYKLHSYPRGKEDHHLPMLTMLLLLVEISDLILVHLTLLLV
ncbi:hypothetical protein KY285_016579 [Solanum tuberosum]|nr:hypothetical protein KY285_016579 [Solanum tuberosum]